LSTRPVSKTTGQDKLNVGVLWEFGSAAWM